MSCGTTLRGSTRSSWKGQDERGETMQFIECTTMDLYSVCARLSRVVSERSRPVCSSYVLDVLDKARVKSGSSFKRLQFILSNRYRASLIT